MQSIPALLLADPVISLASQSHSREAFLTKTLFHQPLQQQYQFLKSTLPSISLCTRHDNSQQLPDPHRNSCFPGTSAHFYQEASYTICNTNRQISWFGF